MKAQISQQVYRQFDEKSKEGLDKVACDCDPCTDDCEMCEGSGFIYEYELSPEQTTAILENLRRQGVPVKGN